MGRKKGSEEITTKGMLLFWVTILTVVALGTWVYLKIPDEQYCIVVIDAYCYGGEEKYPNAEYVEILRGISWYRYSIEHNKEMITNYCANLEHEQSKQLTRFEVLLSYVTIGLILTIFGYLIFERSKENAQKKESDFHP